jgi:hypothetical protein
MIYAVQQSSQFVLRPLEIKHIYDFAIRLYRARFTPMFMSMALAQLPVSLVGLSIGLAAVQFQQQMLKAQGTGELENMDWMFSQADKAYWIVGLLLFLAAYSLLVWPLGALTCARLASTTLTGGQESLRDAFQFALSRYWQTQVVLATFALPILVLALLGLGLTMLAAVAGPGAMAAGSVTALLIIFAGLFATLFAWFRFFPALSGIVQAAEEPIGIGVFAQGIWYLKRAYGLTHGYFLRIFGLTFLLSIATGMIQRGVTESIQLVYVIIAMLNAGDASPDKLITQMSAMQADPVTFGMVLTVASLVSLLFPGLLLCFQTLLYYDLRCRKEGFDLLHALGEI